MEHLGGKRGARGGSVESGSVSAASAKPPGLCVHGHGEHNQGLAEDFAYLALMGAGSSSASKIAPFSPHTSSFAAGGCGCGRPAVAVHGTVLPGLPFPRGSGVCSPRVPPCPAHRGAEVSAR